MPSSESDVKLSLDAFTRVQSVTNAFGGRAPPTPAEGASALPRPPSRVGGEGKGRRGERNREGIASSLFNFWLWAWEQHTDGRTPDRYTDV